MKNALIILLLATCSLASAQKSKKPSKGSDAKMTVLAKADNVTAALVDHRGNSVFYLLAGKAGKPDSILVKAIINKAVENLPSDCKIMPFTAKAAKLYLLTWTEKSTTGDIKSKLEATTEMHSEIWDVVSKKVLYANINKVINITEIVYLDPGKNASKTQEKIRREGFELSLTPDGDIMLKNKTQQDKMTYDAAEKKYVSVKSPAPGSKK